MRTTLIIDDEALDMARIYAEAHSISLGAAVSAMVREPRAHPPAHIRLRRSAAGFPLLRSRGHRITDAKVKRALDKERK